MWKPINHYAQNVKYACPCFVCLIPSSKHYALHVTGRETDSRVTKCWRDRNRAHDLQILRTQLESHLQVFHLTPWVSPGWEGLGGEAARCGRERYQKWCFAPASSFRSTPQLIRILVPDALSHTCSLSVLPFLLPGILSSLKASTVPELPKPIQVKILFSQHFSSLQRACSASSSLLALSFYAPILLSVRIKINLKLYSPSPLNIKPIKGTPFNTQVPHKGVLGFLQWICN